MIVSFKDGKNILELWIERVVPDFEYDEYDEYEDYDEDYDDWYNDREDIFTIGEVDGTLNAVNAEAFDIDNLDKNYYGKSYLKNRVLALFVKYVKYIC